MIDTPPPVDDHDLEELLGKVADEFTERLQHGEQPAIEEYLVRYPQLADVLRQVLPALQVMKPEPPAGPTAAGPAPVDAPLELGDFVIVREVGRGGMGIVYEAEQRSLGRRVALKVLPIAASLDPARLQRFHHEAQAAALLHHSNIVPVFAVGCERGVSYYAMQFIEGRTLAALIAELSHPGFALADQTTGPYEPPSGPCPPSRTTMPQAQPGWLEHTLAEPSHFRTAARLMMQAADALDHAHQMGVLHRDVKPTNLLIDTQGDLWVADFGLARLQNESHLTRTGDVVGTLRYMSPEQLLGRRISIDHRADIYSLGATLYELLTLQPPFTAEDRQDLVRLIITAEPVRPRQRNRSIPADLETICLKAMAKEPQDRYATAAELADDLRNFLEDKPIKARPASLLQSSTRWLRRHRLVVRLCAAGVLLAAVGLTFAHALLWREHQQTQTQWARAEQEKEHARRALADEAVQRQRAEDNLDLALEVLEQLYVRVAEKRLSREAVPEKEDQELLLRALPFYEAFARRNANDPRARRQTGKAYWRVAAIHGILGRNAAAERAYDRAIAFLRPLVADTPGEPEHAYWLAACQHGLADVLVRTGRLGPARRAYETALTLLDGLPAGQVNVPRYRLEAAEVHLRRGDLLTELGEIAAAEQAYRLALHIDEALRTQAPEEPRYRADLATVCTNLGALLAQSGRSQLAQESYGRAAALLDKLVAERPHHAVHRHEWSRVRMLMARLWRDQGALDRAEKAFRQALAAETTLSGHSPGVPVFRFLRAQCLKGLARVLKQTSRSAEALRNLDDALSLEEKLVRDAPRALEYRDARSQTHNDCGLLLLSLGRRAEAGQAFRRALADVEKLPRDEADPARYRAEWAKYSKNLGDSLGATKPREAEACYRRALRCQQALLVQFPAGSAIERGLALTWLGLGGLLATTRPAEAEKAYQEALALREKRLAALPHLPDCPSEVAEVLHELARLRLQHKRNLPEARHLLEGAIRYQENALRLTPDHSQMAHNLQAHHECLILVLLAEGAHEKAARRAEAYVQHFTGPWRTYFLGATFQAGCAEAAARDSRLTAADRRTTAGRHEDRALALLREAIRHGFKDCKGLQKDSRFAILRHRAEFQQFVRDAREQ